MSIEQGRKQSKSEQQNIFTVESTNNNPSYRVPLAQKSRIRRRFLIRLLSLLSAIIFFLFPVVWAFLIQQYTPSNDVVILVADFKDPNQDSYAVNDTILKRLRDATEKYKDVRVETLGKVITEKQGRDFAREEGRKRNAQIVIWGWYISTQSTALISANFEFLKQAKCGCFPGLKWENQGKSRTASIDELNNFKAQLSLSEEMAFLTLVALGQARYTAEDWKASIDFFSDAISNQNNLLKDHTHDLGIDQIYFYRGAAYLQSKDYDAAISDFSNVIRINEKNASAYVNRAIAYRAKLDYILALKDLTQAIQLDSNNVTAYNVRGTIYEVKAQYSIAIQDFTKAISLDANNYDAYVGRGFAYARKQDYDKALQDLTKILIQYPQNSDLYNYQGFIYLKIKKYDQAIHNFKKAIEIDPNNIYSYLSLGGTYIKKKDYESAVFVLEKAIKIQPNDALLHNALGVAYGEKGDYSQALSILNQALKLKPYFADAYDSRGTIYRYMKDYKKALINYEQALKIYKETSEIEVQAAESYFWRGVIYRAQGRIEDALQDFQEATKIQGNSEFVLKAEQQIQEISKSKL
jgi:tetratricopeptide (TPR) repeat protein